MLCVHIGCWCVHTLTRDTDAWARNCSWKRCTSNFTARCKKNTPHVALNCSWNNYRLCPGQCRSFDAVKGWNNGARWKGQEQRTNYPNDLPPGRGDEFILAFAIETNLRVYRVHKEGSLINSVENYLERNYTEHWF